VPLRSHTCADCQMCLVSLITAASGFLPAKHLRAVLVVNLAVKRMYALFALSIFLLYLFMRSVDWMTSHSLSKGGYSYCAVAALSLLKYERWDKSSYMRWVFQRQAHEGGFNGRANKLVDGCYSFWQLGGIAVTDTNHLALFDHFRLQRYILATCQYPSGGLLDKVGKSPDLYHTCYVLSGLRLSCLCCELECARASAEALLNLSRQEVSEER
jgi:hypothetical protein